MKTTKKNTAIVISASFKDFGYRFLALKKIIKFYKENYNIYIVLTLRGIDYDFNVDKQIKKEYRAMFTKEKDWNDMIGILPKSIKYVFFSDADCMELPDEELLLEKAIEELEENDLDGMHCFSDILYLSEYATQIFHKQENDGNIINDFTHKKSGSNGGWASGGLLLFRKDWIKEVKFIDYCWLGAGDTINMVTFIPNTMNTKFSEIWNSELLEDIEQRRSYGIRFGRLNATIIHLFHRSPAFDFNQFRRMFYGQVTKPNVDFNEEIGEPYIEYQDQIRQYKKYIKKGMKIIELIELFNKLRESTDEVKNPFNKHNKEVTSVVLADTYPLEVINKNDILN